MRTTIKFDDALLAEAKTVAVATNRTLAKLVEDYVREGLARRRDPRQPPTPLPTFGRGGLMPGVDLDDGAALLDLMDESAG
jgi:hypothetical protein